MRRRRHQRGFALTEALVSLAVAALTLSLLTAATWGLRQATRDPPAEGADIVDTLRARRILQAWMSGAAGGPSGQPLAFAGQADRVRVVFAEADGPRRLGELRVTGDGQTQTLVARRVRGIGDVRYDMEDGPESVLLRAEETIRFAFLVDRGGERAWVYDVDAESGLPLAVAIEVGRERIATSALPATLDPACISRLGIGEAEGRTCASR